MIELVELVFGSLALLGLSNIASELSRRGTQPKYSSKIRWLLSKSGQWLQAMTILFGLALIGFLIQQL